MNNREIVVAAREKASDRMRKICTFFCPDSSMPRKDQVQAEIDDLEKKAGKNNDELSTIRRFAARILSRRYMRHAV